MSKKILIVYGTRFGSTEEISINFKQTLEKRGVLVDLVILSPKKRITRNMVKWKKLNF